MRAIRRICTLLMTINLAVMLCGAQTETGTEKQIPRFEGFLHSGYQTADNKKVPLFTDVSISEFTTAQKVSADDVLKSIASESKELNQFFNAANLVFKFDTPTITVDGKTVNSFVLVAVYPRKGITGKEEFQNPVAFTPGSIRYLKEVINKFGGSTSKQIWSAEGTKLIGLDGTVYWWGEVGISASNDGSITHVLIRASIKKE